MTILQPPGWPRPKGYSNGIMTTGRMIFTAGVIGWNEREMLVSHRLDQQFAQALRNIVAILAEGGAKPEHIVRLTIYVTSIGERMGGDGRQPQAGGLFALHVPGVQGLPTWRFGA